MLDSIEALSKVRQSCIADTPIPREIQLWLAGSIGRYLDHLTSDLDDAFGLNTGRGGVPWWLVRGIQERDTALRKLAAMYLPDLQIPTQARKIEMLSRRFASCNWQRDKDQKQMPKFYQGTYRECLWIAFQSGARMPLSERHIRNVLKGGAPEAAALPDKRSVASRNIENQLKREKSK
jgi:hypothetical protein